MTLIILPADLTPVRRLLRRGERMSALIMALLAAQTPEERLAAQAALTAEQDQQDAAWCDEVRSVMADWSARCGGAR